MAKLKLYNQTAESRKELSEDFKNSMHEFNYDFVKELEQQIDAHMEYPNIEIYQTQWNRFTEFSKALDREVSRNNKKAELLKYQYLCLIKSQLIKQIEEETSLVCANQEVDKEVTGFIKEEAQFNEFMKNALIEVGNSKTPEIAEEIVKNIKKLNEQVKQSYIALDKNYFNQENKALAESVKDSLIDQNQNHTVGNIGKITWYDWFSNILQRIKSTVSSISSIIFPTIQKEYKGSFWDEKGDTTIEAKKSLVQDSQIDQPPQEPPPPVPLSPERPFSPSHGFQEKHSKRGPFSDEVGKQEQFKGR